MIRKSFRNIIMVLIPGIIMPFMLTSCLDVGDDDDKPPFGIYDTSPTDLEEGVTLDSVIVVTFECDVDAATVTPQRFRVLDGSGSAVSGDIFAGGVTANFTPDERLLPDTDYTVILDENILDIYGRTLGSFTGGDYEFLFTTGSDVPG